MLLIPAPRINPSYKPDFPVELDPEHPLRNSILAAYYHQGNAENLVNGVIANYASGVTNGVNANGRTINFRGQPPSWITVRLLSPLRIRIHSLLR